MGFPYLVQVGTNTEVRSSSLDDFYFQQFYSGWHKIGGSGRKVSASLMQRAVPGPGPRTAIVDFRKPVAVVLRVWPQYWSCGMMGMSTLGGVTLGTRLTSMIDMLIESSIERLLTDQK